jgi:NADPH:quinone reductase-like Zn-dependent oxidoreductase
MTIPSTYRALVMQAPGEPLAAMERQMPEPGPRQALVKVNASSMNYHDMVNLHGLIPGPWPRVPMADGVGEVVAIGTAVSGLDVGHRVIGAFHPGWNDGPPTPEGKQTMPGDTCDGWLQQYVLFDASALIRVPDHLTDVEAATLPCAGTTAWSALTEGRIGDGDVVVTLGTGGVSLYAVQLASALGATVILTSSSDDKLELGMSLGATHCINYRATPDWEKAVRRLTSERGADLVLDLGGAETLAHSVRATRMGGTVAVIGVLTGFGMAQIPVIDTMMNNIRLVGVTVGSIAAHVQLCEIVATAQIRPHISHVLGWDEVGEAMRVMQANEHIGKIALTIS